jgi:hypothetical protein
MKKYTPFLPILSAARFVVGAPKDLVIIHQEEDVTVAGNAVDPSFAPISIN